MRHILIPFSHELKKHFWSIIVFILRITFLFLTKHSSQVASSGVQYFLQNLCFYPCSESSRFWSSTWCFQHVNKQESGLEKDNIGRLDFNPPYVVHGLFWDPYSLRCHHAKLSIYWTLFSWLGYYSHSKNEVIENKILTSGGSNNMYKINICSISQNLHQLPPKTTLFGKC